MKEAREESEGLVWEHVTISKGSKFLIKIIAIIQRPILDTL